MTLPLASGIKFEAEGFALPDMHARGPQVADQMWWSGG